MAIQQAMLLFNFDFTPTLADWSRSGGVVFIYITPTLVVTHSRDSYIYAKYVRNN
jgi:hypothetical protein